MIQEIVRITIDGAAYGDVDLYSPTQKSAWIPFATPLQANSHTVTVTVLAANNPASTGHQVRIDAFVFLN